MLKGDQVGKLEELKARRSGEMSTDGIDELLNRWNLTSKSLDGFTDFYPMRAVTLLEVFTRDWLGKLVDHGTPYVERAEKLMEKSSAKLDFPVALALQGKRFSLGDLVAHSVPLNQFEQHSSAFSVLLGGDLLHLLLRDERVLDRAFNIAGRIGFQTNVLGKSPKNRMESWLRSDAKDYPLLRREPVGLPLPPRPSEPLNWKSGKGEPPAELRDVNRRSHERMRTISLIREPLWNRANWRGAYFESQIGSPPLLALLFGDAAAGEGIFRQGREEIGSDDKEQRLRISFLTGISRTQPNAYRVVIGANPPADLGKDGLFVMLTRALSVDARTPVNLRTFVDSYREAGEFYFAPAFGLGMNRPQVAGELAIKVYRAHIVEAWTVGENDLESTAIHDDDDDVVVPQGESDPPYLRVLARRAAQG
jgi:hypothetical protein